MALSSVPGPKKTVSTVYLATELALTVVPPKVRGVHLIHPGLITLCDDARFSLKRITPDGLERARGAITILRSGGPVPLEIALQRSLMWLQESARPIGLNPIEEIAALKKISRLGDASTNAVERGVGALALARLLSDYSEEHASALLAQSGLRTGPRLVRTDHH